MKCKFVGCVLAVSLAFTAAATAMNKASAGDAKAKAVGETTSLQRSHERFAKSMTEFMLKWMEAGKKWSKATTEMANNMQTACVKCHAVKEQYYQEAAKAWSKQFQYYMDHMGEQLKKDDLAKKAAKSKK